MNGKNIVASAYKEAVELNLKAVNPATGLLLDGEFCKAGEQEINEALVSATESFGIYKNIHKDKKSAFLNAIADEIVAQLKALDVEEIYISFDIDVLDQEYAGATGTPESGGLSPHEPMLIMQTLFENFRISGADMVEIAPQVKGAAIKQIEPETTLMVASSLSTFLIQAMGSK